MSLPRYCSDMFDKNRYTDQHLLPQFLISTMKYKTIEEWQSSKKDYLDFFDTCAWIPYFELTGKERSELYRKYITFLHRALYGLE